MRRDEWIHKGFEVGPPPLGQAVAYLPVASLLALSQTADGCQSLIKSRLETLDLVIFRAQVVTGELEEGVGNLQHQNMWMVVFMTNENAFASASHAMFRIVLLESLQASDYRRILLGLG